MKNYLEHKDKKLEVVANKYIEDIAKNYRIIRKFRYVNSNKIYVFEYFVCCTNIDEYNNK